MKLVEFTSERGNKFYVNPLEVQSVQHVQGSIGAWSSYTCIRMKDGCEWKAQESAATAARMISDAGTTDEAAEVQP